MPSASSDPTGDLGNKIGLVPSVEIGVAEAARAIFTCLSCPYPNRLM
jgi:hypothetical protein